MHSLLDGQTLGEEMINIQIPGGVNVGVNNPGTTVYIKGNENTDGSIRTIYTIDDDLTRVEKRRSGVWGFTKFIILHRIVVQKAPDLSGSLDSRLSITERPS